MNWDLAGLGQTESLVRGFRDDRSKVPTKHREMCNLL